MILPKKFSSNNLALPFKALYWSCKIRSNDWLGVFLVPFSLVLIGVMLHYFYNEPITRGMWFALFWTSTTFLMLYYGQYRIQNIFDQLQGIIDDSKEIKDKEEEVRAKVYGYFNRRHYYIVSFITIIITFPIMYLSFIAHYSSIFLKIWSSIFFLFTAFIGGYGMALAVAFNKIIKEVIDSTPFVLKPFHPDLFMGLKPLGNLAVANAIVASSSSLLFPLIFEVIHLQGNSDLSTFLGYLIFTIIMSAIIASFTGPLFIIKNKIEKGKFALLMDHEAEYQALLDIYKKTPTESHKNILQMLQIERLKLQEIRLFPFESKMMLQIIASVLLPIIILLVQIYFKN